MKKFNAIFVFIACIALCACSKDDDAAYPVTTGELQLTGKVMSPNNAFPISRAKVKVFKDGLLISERTTDAIGSFTVDKLPAGNLQVELSKGKFKRTETISLQGNYEMTSAQSNLNVFPKMAVVRGDYDEIESVLVSVGIVNENGDPAFDILNGNTFDPEKMSGLQAAQKNGHQHGTFANRNASSLPSNVDFSFIDLLHDADLLNTYDIVFLNCGAKEQYDTDAVAMANLKTYIANGGILYATDFMYKYIRAMFAEAEYIDYATPEKSGSGGTVQAHVVNADLLQWLISQGVEADPTIAINGLVSGWQMAEGFNAANVTNWLVADELYYGGGAVNDKSLAFTFPYGSGGVFYSSFHTHGVASDPVIVQLINYFIFEMSAINDNQG